MDHSPQKVYRFDAGGSSLITPRDAIPLTPDDRYHSQQGYGWVEVPDDEFMRLKLWNSRDSFMIDGVIAKRIAFRADVPPGDWRLTLLVEAGLEDSSTVSLFINDRQQPLNWQIFRPPAEGRTEIMSIYRVYHGPAEVDSQGLRFELLGGNDPVRLLGFTIIPAPEAASEAQHTLLSKITSAGRYRSDASLDTLLDEVENLLASNPEDTFAAYWKEQLELLARAERLYNMKGWEWASHETGLGIFDRYHQAVMLLDALLNAPEAENYPLYERALWHRGRLLYWLWLERHGENELHGAQRDLSRLYARYPNDTLLAIYNGKKIDLPDPCDSLKSTPGAPAWSVAQREALCRLRQIIYWWVNEQQAPNGEFGGKLGDDVELLRWWTPVILAGDTVALRGWQRLAECVWESPKVHRGYAKRPSDVEHSSEFIADTAPAMVMYSDDPRYRQRLRLSAEYFENLWTGISDSGHRFFRSAWFSSSEVRTEPPKNRDLEYNTRAVKALRYLAWKTRDPRVIKVLHEWSQAWTNAAMRTDKGKPAGIIPPSVRFPDEAINGDEPAWYIANMYWDYFDWQSSEGGKMLDQLLFTYSLTGDSTLLQPLHVALALIQQQEKDPIPGNDETTLIPGSSAWAAAILRKSRTFWSVAEQWRFITGDDRFDELLLDYGTPYLRYRLTGKEFYLVEGLEYLLENIRYNTPLLTSEVLHTDRVYAPGANNLKAMLTGDGIPESMSPYYAVSWENTDEDFTALVTGSGADQLTVEIFSHSSIAQNVTMRLWQLKPGNYEVKCWAGKKAKTKTMVELKTSGQRFSLELLPRERVTVQFHKH